eukprot:TRINITY_DN2428_c0_g1_i1.p1 TRINITY_DN2428_c0_g1~~TRINITY_DN2428_c0_g1_i1.p1  ORF type:complete len:421 (-),score=88.97 TRINITY_DN2428_c0_g1_i1:87-1349(-)
MSMALASTSLTERNADSISAAIKLDPELMSTFCRRGRRRLQEIQACSQATLKLDRAKGVLWVTGSERAIAEVRLRLECLGGPRKTVSAAVWAELMRTRTLVEGPAVSKSAVERIQHLSGCRVHIERSKHEVRLFGPKSAGVVADGLLNELEEMCTEHLVDSPNAQLLSSDVLHQIAQFGSVSMRVEPQQIAVLGLSCAVQPAVAELKQYMANPDQFEPRGNPDATNSAVAAALSKLNSDRHLPSATTTSASLPPMAIDDSDHSTDVCHENYESRQWSNVGSGASTTPKLTSNPQPPQQQQQQQVLRQDIAHTCCHTCGAHRFCGNCGQQTWQMNMVTFAVPYVQMQPGPCEDSGMRGMVPAAGMTMPAETSQMPQHFIQMGQGNLMPMCFAPGMMPQGMCKDPSSGYIMPVAIQATAIGL